MLKVVSNTSPIINLGKVRQLKLLKELYGEIFIPQAVYDEIVVMPDVVAKIELQNALNWIHILEIQDLTRKNDFKSNLHKGEVEAIILAKEISANLCILDDKNARNYAIEVGLNVLGTIGVLLLAKNNKLLDCIKPLVLQMRDNGMYLSDNVVMNVLKKANEF